MGEAECCQLAVNEISGMPMLIRRTAAQSRHGTDIDLSYGMVTLYRRVSSEVGGRGERSGRWHRV
jgi:hypothetical protein